MADGRTSDTGEILEADAPRRMVIRWQNEWKPELRVHVHGRGRLPPQKPPRGHLSAK